MAVDLHEDLVEWDPAHLERGDADTVRHQCREDVGAVRRGGGRRHEVGDVPLVPRELVQRRAGDRSVEADPGDGAAEGVLHVGDGPVGRGRAVLEQQDPVAEPLDLVHVVGHEDDGRAVGLALVDQVEQQSTVDGVEALRGFVEDEQPRPVHDRDAELHLLLLAAGELVDAELGAVGQAHAGQVVHAPGRRLGTAQPAEPSEVGHHVDDGFLAVEPALFGQVPDATGGGPVRLAVDGQGAGGRGGDAEQGADRRGLAGAVAAEQAERLAGGDVERQSVDHVPVPEPHDEVLHADGRPAHAATLPGPADVPAAGRGPRR